MLRREEHQRSLMGFSAAHHFFFFSYWTPEKQNNTLAQRHWEDVWMGLNLYVHKA